MKSPILTFLVVAVFAIILGGIIRIFLKRRKSPKNEIPIQRFPLPSDHRAVQKEIERFSRIIREQDVDKIETERERVGPEHLPELIALYQSLDNWDDKAALIDLIQDVDDPRIRPLMLDFLHAPGGRVDIYGVWDYWLCLKAVALSFLAGDCKLFDRYQEKPELIEADIKPYLDRGKDVQK